ncbi:MAG TPA: thioredoxin-dependent thiol peroxidase [Candidatus Thermoplasmatota archaeon]|nr:thioredoxin-dependent thiol peroxidase [Candidatus Thermoplasmatota archaeon]
MTVPQVGAVAPDFELLDDSGKPVRLSSFRGRRVVLYFYPKDDTPGCTTEAQGFQEMLSAFGEKNAVVLGVSPDSVESHQAFKKKYGLNFQLLADTEQKAAKAYGVWGLKKLFGKEFMGVTRTTFLIDATGKIARVYENVEPSGHCNVVLAHL